MLAGTVILAHSDEGLKERMERILCGAYPMMHVEKTSRGRDVLMMQSLMRADAVLMEMECPDMPGAHLIHELKRDIVNPCVLVCSRDRSLRAEQDALRLGAQGYFAAPIDVSQICSQLEMRLRQRADRSGGRRAVLEETMLQRVFAERGISGDLKGYHYLKQALRLLTDGEGSLMRIGLLYDRIGVRFGCSGRTVERDIRYAVQKCWERTGEAGERPGNAQFLAMLMEQCRSAHPTLTAPRVSVFASGRRVFR